MIMNWKELVGSGRGVTLKYYSITDGGTKKITKNLNQDSRSPGSRIETSRKRSRNVNHSTKAFGNIRVIPPEAALS